MSCLHQIYCTHCTTDNSAYRLSTNGYAVRGGSLPGEDLRRFYKAIESFIGYHLPSGTPSELKTTLTAAEAPRKMVFSPEVGELQMVCQVCYRQKDTYGRAGSYFAHAMIVPDRSAQDTLTTRKCLQLWGVSQWQAEDPPGDLGVLESFESLDQWAGEQPIICDTLLRHFLTAEDGDAIIAEEEVVPSRLRRLQPGERQDLLRDCLHRYLEASSKKQNLLLVAEPGLAALLFYGIARLLPAGPLSDRISFSTYEDDPETLKTRLAATRFHNPERKDVPPDMYNRPRGAVLNTWLPQRRTKTQQPESAYARRVVELLVDGHWDVVDRFHEDLVHAGVVDSAGLDRLAKLDQELARSLDSALDDRRHFSKAVEKKFLRRRVHRQLGNEDVLEQVLRFSSRSELRVFWGLLNLLAVDPSLADDDPVLVRMLMTKVPEKEVSRFIDREEIPRQRRLTVLERFVTEHHKLPRGGGAAEFLPELIMQLSDEILEQFRDNLSHRDQPRFVLKLAAAVRNTPDRQAILPRMVESLASEQLLDVLCNKQAGNLLRLLPGPPWPPLKDRLQDILKVLPKEPEHFSKRLRALNLARNHLSRGDRNTIVAWRHFEEIVGELADTSNGVHDQALLKAIDRAVPARDSEFDPQQRRIRQLTTITPLVEEQLKSHPELDEIVEDLHLKMIIPIIDEMTEQEFCEFAQDRQHQHVLTSLPAQEPVLSKLLTGVLDGLHEHPREFVERCEVLRVFKDRVAVAPDRLEGWLQVGETMKHIKTYEKQLGTGQLGVYPPKGNKSQQRAGMHLATDLGQALLRAMPKQFLPIADWGDEEQDTVGVHIAQQFLPTGSYDGSFIHMKVRGVLQGKGKPRVSVWTILQVTSALVVISGIILLLVLFGPSSNEVNPTKLSDAGSDEPAADNTHAKEGLFLSESPKQNKAASDDGTSTDGGTTVQKHDTPPMVVAKNKPDTSTPPNSAGSTTSPLRKQPLPKNTARKESTSDTEKRTPIFATVPFPPSRNQDNPDSIKDLSTNKQVSITFDSITKLELSHSPQDKPLLVSKYKKEDSVKTLTLRDEQQQWVGTLSFKQHLQKGEAQLEFTAEKKLSDLLKRELHEKLYYSPLKVIRKDQPDVYIVLQLTRNTKYRTYTPPCERNFSLHDKTFPIPRHFRQFFKEENRGKCLRFDFKYFTDSSGKRFPPHEPVEEDGATQWKYADFGTLKMNWGELKQLPGNELEDGEVPKTAQLIFTPTANKSPDLTAVFVTGTLNYVIKLENNRSLDLPVLQLVPKGNK